MGIDCYYNPLSSPSRGVLLAAKNLGVHMNLKLVNILAGEQYKPEYLKMNPQHAVPTLDDNGFYLYESRAVIQYLANAYGKDDSMYPKDPKQRFKVDQRLFFDSGTLYQSFADAYYPAVFGGQKIDPENLKKIDGALGYLEGFLKQGQWVAGDNMTIADCAIMASLSTMDACGQDVTTKYPLIKQYMDMCKSGMRGYLELNQQGADQYGQFVRGALQKLQG